MHFIKLLLLAATLFSATFALPVTDKDGAIPVYVPHPRFFGFEKDLTNDSSSSRSDAESDHLVKRTSPPGTPSPPASRTLTPNPPADSYRLVVGQWDIGRADGEKHWGFVVPTGPGGMVNVYHIEGNTDTFAYVKKQSDASKSLAIRGGCRVGYIKHDRLEWLDEQFRKVTVTRNDPKFNCQTWVMAAFQLLKTQGGTVISPEISANTIRHELTLEFERSEVGVNTIFDQVCSAGGH